MRRMKLPQGVGQNTPIIEETNNDLDDFKKMKADMQKLGFTSMQEYMEYLKFKRLKQRL